MTPRRLHHLAALALRYPFDENPVARVDVEKAPRLDRRLIKIGCRKYLLKEFKKRTGACNLPSLVRVARLGVLCRAIRRRCVEIQPHVWDKPMQDSLTEWGYSDDVLSRLRHHRDHVSSNYLMNLFDALCQVYMSDYRFHQFVVYHIPVRELVGLAEIYFTRAGQSYSRNGGGMSHTGAGRSNRSSDNYSDEGFDKFLAYTRGKTSMETNIAGYEARMDDKIAELDKATSAGAREIEKCERNSR